MYTQSHDAPFLRYVLALTVLGLPLAGCKDDETGPTTAMTLARERAAAHFEDDSLARARQAIAPLVAGKSAEREDLIRAAVIEFHDGKFEASRTFLTRVERLAKHDPAMNYIRGRMSLAEGDFNPALEYFRAAHEAAPDDLPTMLGLAGVLYDLDQPTEAEELYRSVLAVGVEHGGSWYVSAVYRLYRMAIEQGNEDESRRYVDLWESLKARGYTAVTARDLDQGNLGRVRPPAPHGTTVPTPGMLPRFTAVAPILPELAGARELFALDLNGDRRPDLLASGPRGVQIAVASGDDFVAHSVVSSATDLVRAIDLGNDDDLDLLVVQGSSVRFLIAEEGAYTESAIPHPELGGTPADITPVDFDHDGDIDLLFAGPFGAALWRNDGAAVEGGSYADATRDATLPQNSSFTWCAIEDLDSDQDVDLILGGPDGMFLADSLRGGRFADRTREFFGDLLASARPILADFDGDARPDVFCATPPFLARQAPDGRLQMDAQKPAGVRAPLAAVDLDHDGALDVFWSNGQGGVEGLLAVGLTVQKPARLELGEAVRGPFVFVDLDRDQLVDLVSVDERGVLVQRGEANANKALRLVFLGVKDNKRGIGAVVELRAGELYRRIFWEGLEVLVGIGERELVDVVRITWPNGVVQTLLDVELGDGTILDSEAGALSQPEGLIGSCPFLYTWNGQTFTFISDVLGITPLGLPMAPGLLVPPDHDEYVLVRGDQLVPREGMLEMQFTEELREVTYLDRVRLDVVDHPPGVEIYPDERFTFPPFPEPHTHTVRAPLAPLRATGSDGKDWTPALARIDDVHAVPFEPLAPQFLGLATPHWIELEFDPETLRDAPKLRLIMTGWFYWTDASVNMASARTPGVDFVPPLLQVPGPPDAESANGETRWVDTGPPLGFPAGKTKTMVIDVTELLQRDDPRLRIFSTLRLYWDSIRLAVDADDAPLTVTSLEPASAKLWSRGFSRPVDSDNAQLPERFQWNALAAEGRWNQHPGWYTRFGETLPLLESIDDQFVIMGAGDALHMFFDASALPAPAPGLVRDYLVFFDGWAKDRDPNTLEALEVEPLPFHGMSGYPYGPDEAFPDDEAHRQWRAEWNTRPAYPWIVPLAPRREVEWVLARPVREGAPR